MDGTNTDAISCLGILHTPPEGWCGVTTHWHLSDRPRAWGSNSHGTDFIVYSCRVTAHVGRSFLSLTSGLTTLLCCIIARLGKSFNNEQKYDDAGTELWGNVWTMVTDTLKCSTLHLLNTGKVSSGSEHSTSHATIDTRQISTHRGPRKQRDESQTGSSRVGQSSITFCGKTNSGFHHSRDGKGQPEALPCVLWTRLRYPLNQSIRLCMLQSIRGRQQAVGPGNSGMSPRLAHLGLGSLIQVWIIVSRHNLDPIILEMARGNPNLYLATFERR